MKVLIVDDSTDLAQALTIGFKLQWPFSQVLTADNGEKGLAIFQAEGPDLVILDIAMPGMNGFEVLRRLRQVSDTPVIMLTVKGEELDKVRALELGADDYVTKPFGSLELMARIKAVLRRTETKPDDPGAPPLTCGHLVIDYASGRVSLRGRHVKLTPTEYKLLCHLARHPNTVISRQALLARVWGSEYRVESDFLKVYIKRLRAKLEEDPANPRYILTEWGEGYKLACPS